MTTTFILEAPGPNTDDLREWELRQENATTFINRWNMMHTSKACGGRTSQPVPHPLVMAAWENGLARSSRGSARVIGWCPHCCVKRVG